MRRVKFAESDLPEIRRTPTALFGHRPSSGSSPGAYPGWHEDAIRRVKITDLTLGMFSSGTRASYSMSKVTTGRMSSIDRFASGFAGPLRSDLTNASTMRGKHVFATLQQAIRELSGDTKI